MRTFHHLVIASKDMYEENALLAEAMSLGDFVLFGIEAYLDN